MYVIEKLCACMRSLHTVHPFELFFVYIVPLNYFPMKLAKCLPAQGNLSRTMLLLCPTIKHEENVIKDGNKVRAKTIQQSFSTIQVKVLTRSYEEIKQPNEPGIMWIMMKRKQEFKPGIMWIMMKWKQAI
jgi:hypothetical protein